VPPARWKLAVVCILLLAVCSGCASTGPVADTEALDFKSRAVTHSDGEVVVSASALSAQEGRDIYGESLDRRGVQPVWIEVENGETAPYWLMSPGVDTGFFLPSEVADAFGASGDEQKRQRLRQRFEALAFRNPVLPGSKVSGFVLTNLDEGIKMIQVDLVGDRRHRSFSFFSTIPGFRADYRRVFFSELYREDELIDYSTTDAFRDALAALPCCVTNKDGSKNGDPLNLVVVGDLDDAFPALVRQGWRPTEETYFGSVYKMMMSVLSGDRYPYSPISPLYLYARPQDLALQKARDNIHQRNHLRLWLSPMRYQGKHVWVGQISRDIGTRLTIHSPYLTTHKIDPDVDEARTALMEDMAYSQSLAQLGLVAGVGAAEQDAPRANLTTDPYHTDGFRAVLIFDVQPRGLDQIEFLPWEGREGGFIHQSTRQGQ